MAWSSYAHLPNREEEYWEILSKLKNGMSISEVDRVIAEVKGKQRVQHHYRSNLANIGLFDIDKGIIYLKYDVNKLVRKKKYLKEVLSQCLEQCKSKEISVVRNIVCKEKTYDISVVAECLVNKYPDIEKNNFIRWVRPIVNMFKIIDVLSENKDKKLFTSEKFLQDAYLKLTSKYGIVVALEELDIELKKIDSSYDVVTFVEKLLCDLNMKFKIELLMLPNWATSNKAYVINKEYYTHIKIKGDLLEGRMNEEKNICK